MSRHPRQGVFLECWTNFFCKAETQISYLLLHTKIIRNTSFICFQSAHSLLAVTDLNFGGLCEANSITRVVLSWYSSEIVTTTLGCVIAFLNLKATSTRSLKLNISCSCAYIIWGCNGLALRLVGRNAWSEKEEVALDSFARATFSLCLFLLWNFHILF